MRISSRLFIEQSVNAIVDQQTIVGNTQLKLAEGKRLLTPADDPVAATQILGIDQEIARLNQLQQNVDFADSRLRLEETTLKGVDTTFFRVRELVIQGMNTVLPPASRQSIVAELRLRLDEMIGLANTKDGSGEFIFSGFNGSTKPFSRDITGNLVYVGDEGQRFVQISSSVSVAISDSGFETFQNIRRGNGTFVVNDNAANTGSGIIDQGTVIDPTAYVIDDYTITFANGVGGQLEYTITGAVTGAVAGPIAYTDGSNITFNGMRTSITGTPQAGDTFTVIPSRTQSIFTTIENAISLLNNDNQIQRQNGLNNVLTDLDQTLDNFSEIRAQIGARLNTIDIERDVNASLLLFQQESRSALSDLDFTVAASDLSRQSLALQAAQQSFVRIQNLTLFNFLR